MTVPRSTRPLLKDHLHPGLRVINIHHRQRVYRIFDLHDEDRTALIVGRDGTRSRIPYGDLVRDYQLVQPFRSAR